MVPTLLITLLSGIGRAVVERYVSADGARSLVNLALDAVDSLNEAEATLQQIDEQLAQKIADAKANGTTWAPSQSELDKIWADIKANDAEWAKIP